MNLVSAASQIMLIILQLLLIYQQDRIGFRYYIKIKGAPDASLGEVAEKT